MKNPLYYLSIIMVLVYFVKVGRKNQELKDFYQLMPEKFNNKTNGITQRRFLLHGNPLLAEWVTHKIGNEWITNLPHIHRLAVYADDLKLLSECSLSIISINRLLGEKAAKIFKPGE